LSQVQHAHELRIGCGRILSRDVERERRGLHRTAAAFDNRERGQEIAHHALPHAKLYRLSFDLARALEVTDAIPIHDDLSDRQTIHA
jgi:hypothetical protein